MAEVIKHYYPTLVELHNYPTGHSVKNKKGNWELLNLKVFQKLNLQLDRGTIHDLSSSKQGVVERLLQDFKEILAVVPASAVTSVTHSDSQKSDIIPTSLYTVRFGTFIKKLNVLKPFKKKFKSRTRSQNNEQGDCVSNTSNNEVPASPECFHICASEYIQVPVSNDITENADTDGSSSHYSDDLSDSYTDKGKCLTLSEKVCNTLIQDKSGKTVQDAESERKEILQQIYACDEELDSLKLKIRHLENISKMKDEMVQRSLQRMQETCNKKWK